VDGLGNVYVTGDTSSSDFPSAGGFDASLSGPEDAFVTKVSAAGSSLAWSSYLGGSDGDFGSGIAVDGLGNVYVAGSTWSADFPSAGGFDTAGDGSDAFVTKVNADGSSLAWSSYLGGSGDDGDTHIAVDRLGNAYLTGDTWSSDFPSAGGFDATFGGGDLDAFVTKVNATGSSLAWSSYLGGSMDDIATSIAVDAVGNAYVTGTTCSTDFPSAGGFASSPGGPFYCDAFVTKVNAAGSSLAWSSYLGGSGNEGDVSGIAVDGLGDVYVVGDTSSSDFPSAGGFDTSLDGSYDAFVTKVNASGSSLAWSSYLGGSAQEGGYGIAVDPVGNVYVAGTTYSSDFPSTGGFDTTLDGIYDGFVTRISQCNADGACTLGENPCNCPADCGADTCGNGCCGPAEDKCACPADCLADVCGDGCCSGPETACYLGCESECPDVCGDGCCTGAEDCAGCPGDCGICSEPALDAGSDAGQADLDIDGPVRDMAADAGGTTGGSACDCSVGGARAPTTVLWWMAGTVIAVFRRRRRG
jgi:MYXO-CTERM domain-containing protein